jgi:hypothetical protein
LGPNHHTEKTAINDEVRKEKRKK